MSKLILPPAAAPVEQPEESYVPQTLPIDVNDTSELTCYMQPLHQSSMSTCLRCKRKFMYRDRWCLRPKFSADAGARSQGHLVHRLMEVGPDGVYIVRDEVAAQMQKLTLRIDAGEDLLGDLASVIKQIKDYFNKALMIAEIYWANFPTPDNHEIIAKEKLIYIYVDLDMHDGTTTKVAIGGTVDQVLINKDTGDAYIRDFKSTSRDVEYTLTGYQFSLQCRMYRLLASAIVKKAPKGFILDLLQMPTIKFCKKDANFDAYVKRCRSWYIQQGKKAIRSFSILYNEPLDNPELYGNLRVCSAYQRAMPPKDLPGSLFVDMFPRDTTTATCKDYQRVCDYYMLCNTSMAAWPALLHQHFVVVEPKMPLTPNIPAPLQESEQESEQESKPITKEKQNASTNTTTNTPTSSRSKGKGKGKGKATPKAPNADA